MTKRRSPARRSYGPGTRPRSTTPCQAALRGRGPRRRRAAALLIALFVTTVASILVISVVDIQTVQMTAQRHAREYERALYLAGAAAHHALALLEDDPAWRDGVSSTEFPTGSGDTYSAQVSDAGGNTVLIEASGTSGSVTRNLQVTVEMGS